MNEGMAPLRQKHMKSDKSLDAVTLVTMQKVPKVETMDIDGIRYFPCRICNRLFKDEKFAICHLKKCKPRVYLVANEELGNRSSKYDNKDPYEIIPEEIELEGQIVNASSNNNKNGPGNVKWKKNFQKYNNNNETEVSLQKLHTNSSVLDIGNNSTCTTDQNKAIVQSVDNSLETEDIIDEELSIGSTSRTEETISKNDEVNIIEKETPKKKKKILNTERQRRNYRQLTEQEIEERLKKISDRLKKHKQPQTINEEEEEEERRDIEERLSVLNKDSEVGVIQNGNGQSDVRLKERNISSKPFEHSIENCKVSVSSNIFGDISKNDVIQQRFGSMQSMKNEMMEFREGALNDQSEIDRVVVITQRLDGQLYDCRKCSQVFLSSLELLRHSRRVHTYPRIIMAPSEIKKFMTLRDRSHCPICEKPLSSTYKSIYVKHLQTHSCVLEHICPICKKKFKRRDHMRAHQKRHIVGDMVESTELNENEEMETEDSQEFVESTQIFIKGQIS